MPASTPEVPKGQPWKANWPPAQNAAKTSHQYISDDTGALLVDGAHNCTSADPFAELLCSRKDTEPSKAQPWKASWPPAQNAAKTNHQYISDDTGALLVDGAHDCTSADSFAELLCSRTDTEPAKAQPWKANWPPVQNAAKTGHQYISDDGGALLVDGDAGGPGGSGDLFAELLCSRKDTEPSKAQPWKANWPPARNAAKTGHQYITDDSGALLVDGAGAPGGGGGSGDFFAELA